MIEKIEECGRNECDAEKVRPDGREEKIAPLVGEQYHAIKSLYGLSLAQPGLRRRVDNPPETL